jgi:hypothetical protein
MSEQNPTPQYESGGGKLIAGAAILVIAALAGIVWSLTSRQQAPPDAPVIKSRFLPPSERKEPAATAVTPAPTLEKATTPTTSTAAPSAPSAPEKTKPSTTPGTSASPTPSY